MDYRAKVEKSWQAHLKKHGLEDSYVVSGSILGSWDCPTPKSGDTWGPWTYRSSNLVLEYERGGYEVDLETCETTEEIGDWIIHLGQKKWCTPVVLGQFVKALNDLLKPEHNVRHLGQGERFNVRQFLKPSKAKRLAAA